MMEKIWQLFQINMNKGFHPLRTDTKHASAHDWELHPLSQRWVTFRLTQPIQTTCVFPYVEISFIYNNPQQTGKAAAHTQTHRARGKASHQSLLIVHRACQLRTAIAIATPINQWQQKWAGCVCAASPSLIWCVCGYLCDDHWAGSQWSVAASVFKRRQHAICVLAAMLGRCGTVCW